MNTPRQAREIQPRKWADAYLNSELISIGTMSGYRMQAGDPSGAHHDMGPHISDNELGSAVMDCLSRSRFLETEESRRELFDFEAGQRNYLAWVERLMQFGSYKTRRALFKQMVSCGIEQEDDKITIRQTHHETRRLERRGVHCSRIRRDPRIRSVGGDWRCVARGVRSRSEGEEQFKP